MSRKLGGEFLPVTSLATLLVLVCAPPAAAEPGRGADPADVDVPAGYDVEVAAEGLTYATDVAFDDPEAPLGRRCRRGAAAASFLIDLLIGVAVGQGKGVDPDDMSVPSSTETGTRAGQRPGPAEGMVTVTVRRRPCPGREGPTARRPHGPGRRPQWATCTWPHVHHRSAAPIHGPHRAVDVDRCVVGRLVLRRCQRGGHWTRCGDRSVPQGVTHALSGIAAEAA
jgi:hypothetical protein